MKQFRFTKLKRIRELEEKLAEEAFAEAVAKVNKLASRSRELTERYMVYKRDFIAGKVSWLELANIIKAMTNLKKEMIEAYNNLQEKRKELINANMRLKMIERLEEIWKEEVFREELQSLQEVLDDFASYKSFIEKS